MKKFLLIFFILQLALVSYSQELGYQIGTAYRKSITKDQLSKARTLLDVNPGFPSSWISLYSYVALSLHQGDKTTTIRSINEKLNAKQIALLKSADEGDAIAVSVLYNPDSKAATKANLREIKFSYTIVPFLEAHYPDGYEKLEAYFKDATQEKIAQLSNKDFPAAFVTFTIDEQGQAINAVIRESSGNDLIDKLLLDSISKMSKWQPAEKASGEKVTQKFELRVGNRIGC